MSNPNVNNFDFELAVAPGITDRFTFMDARQLSQAGNVADSLAAIVSAPSNIDYSQPLSAEQLMWVIVASQVLFEGVQFNMLEADPKQSFAEAFAAYSVAPFTGLHAKLAARNPQSVADLKAAIPSLLSTLRAQDGVDAAFFRDFKNDVLYTHTRNLSSENFEIMRKRVVDGIQGGVTAMFVGKPSTGHGVIVIGVPDTNTLRGASSYTLIGFGSKFFPAQDYTPSSLSPTQEAIAKAAKATKATGPQVLKPKNQAQLDSIIAQGESVAREIIESGEVGPASANDLRKALNASVDSLLNDPSSPYYGKQYTRAQMVSIAAEGIFGAEGVSALREAIAQGLENCIRQIDLLTASISFAESYGSAAQDPDYYGDDLVALDELLEEAIADYSDLIEYASIIYEINTPDRARQNDGGISVGAIALYGTVTITAVSVVALYILKEINDREDKACRSAAQTLKGIYESMARLLENRMQTATTLPELNDLRTILTASDANAQSMIQKSICERDALKGMECLAHLSSWDDTLTFAQKKAKLELAATCLGVEVRRVNGTIATIDKRIEKRNAEDPLSLWFKFLGNIPKIGSSILTYAAYTALGLGVIWGAGKVYKALKSGDEG
jgi:hypothetical protein